MCIRDSYINEPENLHMYHPSMKQYMTPAYSATNPVTFEWTGDMLYILVDETVVATWSWAERKWY